MNNFSERVLTSVLFVIVLLGAIIQSNFAAAILFFVMILLCQREFYNFFKPSDVKPLKLFGIIGGLGFFTISALVTQDDLRISSFYFLIPVIFLIFVIELYRKRPLPIPNIATTILGVIYIAVPITLLHELAYFSPYKFGETYHYEPLMAYFFVLWANDTGAYLIGSKLGKNKLFPSISPKKTWEGSIGGAVLALIVSYVNSLLFPLYGWWLWMSMGLIIILFGSWGDLVESMFKRSLNIKDSGKLLPGHGGVLDRFDGIFISAPMVYFFLRLLSLLHN
ncbi:MAG: phosphatidate cytidylyltransferase [Flavobacteriales bacterium]|nr:phosphatidate cytidylyltransferase [Flavobacteriales bacterium]